MARLPRLAVAGQPHLVVQRSPPGHPAFACDADRADYLEALREVARDPGIALHAYVLLEHQARLLLTPTDAPALGRFMQRVNRRYVPAFHRRHGGAGAVWAGRFQAAVVDPEHYLLPATLWIEQAPVRAGLVAHATEWAWSSAAHHAGRSALPWLTAQACHWRMGNTPFEREARHENELQRLLPEARVAELEAAVRGGWVLGAAAFVAALDGPVGRPSQPRPRGRPRQRAPARG